MLLILISLIFGLFIIQYYAKEQRTRRLSPPGPWSIPFLGNTIQIATASSKSHLAFSKLALQYGDVFRVKIGEYEHVILTSSKAIMEVFGKEETAGRAPVGVLSVRKGNSELGPGLGIAWSEGDFWAKKRFWTIRKLRESGFGKSSQLETGTKEEVQSLLDDWDSQLRDQQNLLILEVSELFLLSVAKIMWKLMIGRFNEEDEVMMKRFFKLNQEALSTSGVAALSLIAPTVCKYIFPTLTGYTAMGNLVSEMRIQSKKYLNEFSKLPSTFTGTLNLVHEYTRQMKTFPKDFFEEDFATLFTDLMQGGSDTTSILMEYLMLYMILYPEVQEKVLQEIETVIPKGQDATVEDMDQMPFTQACILEAQRLGKITPLLVPKRVTKDFAYRNYLIKKDTIILGDLFSAFHSKDFGPTSWDFVPDRFLQKDIDGCWEWNGLDKKVVCFGYGKRIWPGQRLTEIASFVMFVAIVKRYKLSVVPNEAAPKITQMVGFTCNPSPFRMAISLREGL